MIKNAIKKVFLRLLFLQPHNNIYEFHHVSRNPDIDLSPRKIDTDAFQHFVEKHGPYLPLADILCKKEMKRYAAITFDDGLEDLYTIAYQYLSKKNIPFTAFVLSDKVDQPGYITREQLAEMAANPLVTIGSHGTDHTKLAQADEKKQRMELFESKKAIEGMTGRPCEYFAYPFGQYNDTTLHLMAEAGYVRACAVKGRAFTVKDLNNAYTVPRLSIEDGTLQFYNRA